MPLVRITLMGDVLSDQQKREVITNVTDGIVAVVGENLRPYTIVSVDETKSGDIAIGGQQITPDAIRAIAAGGVPAGV